MKEGGPMKEHNCGIPSCINSTTYYCRKNLLGELNKKKKTPCSFDLGVFLTKYGPRNT